MQRETDSRYIKLRKYENILGITGVTIIAFGMWSIIKAALFFIIRPYDLEAMIGPDQFQAFTDAGITGDAAMGAVFMGGIFLALVFDLILRLYIGRSAITEARGKKNKTIFYVVLAILMAGTIVLNLIYGFSGLDQPQDDAAMRSVDSVYASRVLDLTSLIALVEMINASIRVRKLRRELAIEKIDADLPFSVSDETGLGV